MSKLLGFRGVPGGGYFSGISEVGYRLGKNDDVSAAFSRTAIEANTSSLPKLCVSKAPLSLVSSLLRFLSGLSKTLRRVAKTLRRDYETLRRVVKTMRRDYETLRRNCKKLRRDFKTLRRDYETSLRR